MKFEYASWRIGKLTQQTIWQLEFVDQIVKPLALLLGVEM